MTKFFDYYSSFEEFFDSLLRGNEIEFLFKSKRYYLLPVFSASQDVDGVVIGNLECETYYHSKAEVCKHTIEGLPLIDILDEIEIVWRNF